MVSSPDPDAAPLLVGLAAWLAAGAWMWASGWRVQHRHLSAAGRGPVDRGTLVWLVLLIGAAALLVGRDLPSVAAPVVVSMVGAVSVLVDARCHRLPDPYTAVMAAGVALGALGQALGGGAGVGRVAVSALVGAAVWTLPLWAGALVDSGVGRGDVKLAPVLGAMTGLLGWEAAVSGLVVAFLAAGVAALWQVVARSGTLRTRIALGPWLWSGALVAVAAWGVAPGLPR